MHISLLDVILDEGRAVHEVVPFEREAITVRQPGLKGSGKVSYPVLHSTPIDLTVTNTGDRILEVGGSCSVTVGIPCDRCLRETACEIPVQFSHRINIDSSGSQADASAGPGRVHARQEAGSLYGDAGSLMEDGPVDIEEAGESPYLSDTDLDADELVCLEVLMNWPSKVLCREDCKGLCPRCGRDLNEGPCGCEDEPDLRMAVIGDLFS